MSQPKVSVIIPVHNGSRYIQKTAKGILAQDYENIELILVENFSSDKSLELCEQLKQADKRVIVVQSTERGTSLARKKGVETATGKYIIFSDQDDEYISKSSISKMQKAISDDNAQITQFNYYKY